MFIQLMQLGECHVAASGTRSGLGRPFTRLPDCGSEVPAPWKAQALPQGPAKAARDSSAARHLAPQSAFAALDSHGAGDGQGSPPEGTWHRQRCSRDKRSGNKTVTTQLPPKGLLC